MLTRSCCSLLALALLRAPVLSAQDSEFDEAKAFLRSREELSQLAPFLDRLTRVGPGLYRVDLGKPVLELFLLKQNLWSGVLWLKDPSILRLDDYLPADVIGQVPVYKAAFLVVGGANGTLSPVAMPSSELRSALTDALRLVPQPTVGMGVNLFAVLSASEDGLFGTLARANVVPSDLLLSGTVTKGLTDQVFTSVALSPSITPKSPVTVSLTVSAGAFTPFPFGDLPAGSLIPKPTFGATSLSLIGTKAALSIAGSQVGSTVQVGSTRLPLPETRLTVTPLQKGGGYSISAEGILRTRIAPAFGIPGVAITAIGLRGTLESKPVLDTLPDKTTQKPLHDSTTRAVGIGLYAQFSVDGVARSFEGQLSTTIRDRKLVDAAFNVTGSLDFGFTGLPGGRDFAFTQFGIGLNPASKAGYLLGAVEWKRPDGKTTSGDGAFVLIGNAPTVFLHVDDLNLSELLKGANLGPLPRSLDALFLLSGGARPSTSTDQFPEPVKAMIKSAAGFVLGQIALRTGLMVLTHADAADLGATPLGIAGPLTLMGGIDVGAPGLDLYASLATVPPIPGLPQGFGVSAPQFFFSVGVKDLVPRLAVGLALSMTAPLNGQPTDPLLFTGRMAASTSGTFSFTGLMQKDWVEPLGLKNMTIRQPVAVTVGVGADASVDVGFQGGARIGTLVYDSLAFCVNIQAAYPPVPKKLAVNLQASELGLSSQVALWNALVHSVTDGPMKGYRDPLVAQVGAKADEFQRNANALPLAQFKVTNGRFFLATPAISCDLPAIAGMGAALRGTGWFLGRQLGAIDSYVDLQNGLKVYSKINPFNFGDVLRVDSAYIDVLLPMPGSPAFNVKDPGHFYISGKTSVLNTSGFVQVVLDTSKASFELDARLADLGTARFWARTVGRDLTSVSDFQMGLRSSSDAEKQLLAKLGQALNTTAAQRRSATTALQRQATADLTQAKKAFDAAADALDDALKPVNAALAACVKAFGKAACKPAQDAVNAVKNGTKATKKANAQATYAAKQATARGLSDVLNGWNALDRSVSQLSKGLADNLITLDQLALDGSLRRASGSLKVVARVGTTPIDQTYTVNLMGDILNVVAQAERIADEVERQAKVSGSAVQRAMKH